MSLTSLREQIESAMVRRQLVGRTLKFLPVSAVDELLTPATIGLVLTGISLQSFDGVTSSELASIILKAPAKKILIILVLIDKVHALPSILSSRITDNQLPTYHPAVRFCGHFIDVQWEVTAPVFHRNIHSKFDNLQVLPYINEGYTDIPESRYGMVRKVEIHHAHHNLGGPWSGSKVNYVAAIKTLVNDQIVPQETLDTEFEHEKTILELLNDLKHPSIMELLCTYQHGLTYNFMFPYAELDLARFLTLGRDDVPLALRTNREVYWAMYGLADALKSMHEHSFADANGQVHRGIYHHDLHPANIVIRGKMFILADFGTASTYIVRQSQESGWSSRALCKWRTGTETYGPPEIDPEPRQREIDPFAVDLWSFGCILLEVMLYTVEGDVALRTFRERKNTWIGRSRDECFHRAFGLKQEVAEQLDFMRAKYDDRVSSELLDICERLLDPRRPYRRREVKLPEDMLSALQRTLERPSRPLRIVRDQLLQQKSLHPLHFAASGGDDQELWELLDSKVDDLQSVDMEGRLPIHWCIVSGSSDLLKSILSTTNKRHLLKLLHTKDNRGDTPLSLALQYHNFAMVLLLAEAETDPLDETHTHAILESNNTGKTPLHLAVETRLGDIVEDIIRFIAKDQKDDKTLTDSLLAKDAKGRIPLHYAAESPFSRAHLILLNTVPALRTRMLEDTDDQGKKPVDLARDAGFTHFAYSNFAS